jgi:hypothetical protein
MSDITGISRAVMKDNAQVTIEDYNGNARPGELVVDQTTDQVFIGNSSGALTQIAAGITNGGSAGLPAGFFNWPTIPPLAKLCITPNKYLYEKTTLCAVANSR